MSRALTPYLTGTVALLLGLACAAQEAPRARLGAADMQQITRLLGAQDVADLPIPEHGSGKAQLDALLTTALDAKAGRRLPEGAAAELGRLTERALTKLPTPRPFPFHLDAAIGFRDQDAVLLLLVCRICRYGTVYLRSGGRTVSSGRIATGDMDRLLSSVSKGYESAPHTM